MNNSNNYEICIKNMEILCKYYKSNYGDRNEATTRFRLIDTLFFECLDWTKDDMISEESCEGQYADYTFNAPRRILIVEAKKEGNYFELPVGQNKLEYSIQSIFRDYPNIKSAIEQVTGYCQSRGAPYAAVCNGHQIIILIATRSDGLSPFEGKALVFPSLEYMLENFLELWQVLSKPGIEAKCLNKRLTGDMLPEIPPKLSLNIVSYPGVINRNIFQTDLQIVSDLVFEDIISSYDLEKSFLEECYCPSGALSQHLLISKSILQAKYASLFESNDPALLTLPVVDKNGISSELVADSFSRRPILLIGDVGVGKTTFIKHLLNVDAVQIFDNAITLYLDLGSKATLTSNIKETIINEIFSQLNKNYEIDIEERNFVRGVYHSELEKFRRGIYRDLIAENHKLFIEKEIEFLEDKISNKENHLNCSLNHIVKAHKKQIVIFLDNCDQRSYETQQKVFLIAQEIAEHWLATVFMSLRPETFHISVREGALSGYHPKAFTISPPRIDKVISKRLTYALKLANGEIPIKALPKNIRVRLPSFESIIKVFLYSLENNNDLVEFIENISGGNVRLALGIVKDFFGSGHVNTEKIRKIYDSTNKYLIPIHEFLRAVIYGDTEYYDPDQSIIINLFDITRIDNKEHFLLCLIISMLENISSSDIEGGFVETNRIYERMQGIGFTPDQIDNAIIKGYRKKLIETSARKVPNVKQKMPQSLRATTVGIYHISRLLCEFTYYDSIVIDTPILNDDVRLNIKDVHDIISRLDRAEYFCNYLEECWIGLKDLGTSFNFDSILTEVRSNIKRIRIRALISQETKTD